MTRNNGNWTESKFHSFIKSALRAASSRWPPKFECINNAFVGKKTNQRTGREAKHYKCNCCWGEFPASEIQVDHISPVIDPFKGFVSWDDVVERMFCEADGYQVLCKECHKSKTQAERLQAKERKANDKSK
jgi:hypothetical protein